MGALKELINNIIHMPRVIRIFWIPQLFTWFGLFSMWLYFGLGIAQNIYGLPPSAVIQGHPLFSRELMKGVAWGGICFATYQGVSCLFAFLLPTIARRIGGKTTYGLTLVMGGIGLVGALFVRSPDLLLVCMVGVGIAWAGIMTMPYSIIAAAISQRKRGVYMGIFNITITVPQIICALVLSVITQYFFHNHAMNLVGLGGACMLAGGCLMVLIQWRETAKS
ncbi:MAG: hypothetical protein COB66_08575 [Coxiella sp. (in: Bacteria)]|nr:MAG: hypothetical protein COB66_08575 [Coxiella sp. (in: g-proteobacteria)]